MAADNNLTDTLTAIRSNGSSKSNHAEVDAALRMTADAHRLICDGIKSLHTCEGECGRCEQTLDAMRDAAAILALTGDTEQEKERLRRQFVESTFPGKSGDTKEAT